MFRPLRWALVATVIVAGFGCQQEPVADTTSPPVDPAYRQEVHAWRQEREERLQAEEGWLSLSGLFWLQEGENRFGDDPGNDIVLRTEGTSVPAVPAYAGSLWRQGAQVRLLVAPGIEVLADGEPVEEMVLASGDEDATELTLGRLSLVVLQRGDRMALRVRDPEHPARTGFAGLEWYPVDPRWKLTARFEPYQPPRRIPVANVVGQTLDQTSPGALVFEVAGSTYRLDALDGGEDRLFVIFADASSGKETYAAGRYVYTPKPAAGAGGTVELDLNRAYNPPCAFTAFATCPLPPPQNRLPFPIPAGERQPPGGDHGHA